MTTYIDRLIIDRDKLIAQIALLETAQESIVVGQISEYTYSEPDGLQKSVSLDILSIQKVIEYKQRKLDRIYRKLEGRGLRAVRTSR